MSAPAVCKRRLPKAYRVRELDLQLRRSRTLAEARMLATAKKAGVKCPLVYYVDLQRTEIIEQRLDGTLLSRLPAAKRAPLAKKAGGILGKMHSIGIYHGDYTTTNLMLCNDDSLQVIDFGLSSNSRKTEDFATDILLYKKSVTAKEFGNFVSGYSKGNPESAEVLARLEDIESRGRYVARAQ